MLDSIYHMTYSLLKNDNFDVKMSKILPSFTLRYNGRNYITR